MLLNRLTLPPLIGSWWKAAFSIASALLPTRGLAAAAARYWNQFLMTNFVPDAAPDTAKLFLLPFPPCMPVEAVCCPWRPAVHLHHRISPSKAAKDLGESRVVNLLGGFQALLPFPTPFYLLTKLHLGLRTGGPR